MFLVVHYVPNFFTAGQVEGKFRECLHNSGAVCGIKRFQNGCNDGMIRSSCLPNLIWRGCDKESFLARSGKKVL